MKNFNGRPFFSVCFIARVNQKIRILAPGRRSTLVNFKPPFSATEQTKCQDNTNKVNGGELHASTWWSAVCPAGKIRRPRDQAVLGRGRLSEILQVVQFFTQEQHRRPFPAWASVCPNPRPDPVPVAQTTCRARPSGTTPKNSYGMRSAQD
jgi:hypothetical protein